MSQVEGSSRMNPVSRRIRVGVNGFGRFGMHLVRDWIQRRESLGFDLVWVNEPMRSPSEIHAELVSDVVLGPFGASVGLEESAWILEDGHRIRLSRERDVGSIPWEHEVDWVFECTGKFTDRKDASRHLRGDIERVFISATSLSADRMVVLGVTEQDYDPRTDRLISYGSCTINAFMPIAQRLHERFGILESGVNVTHNTPIKDIQGPFGTILRRTCTLEVVAPRLMPALEGRFFVNYHLVPYPGVSLIDFQFRLGSSPSAWEVRRELELAAEGGLAIHLGWADDFTRPERFVGHSASAVLVRESFKKAGDTIIFSAWFDNENSAVRLNDLGHFAVRAEAGAQLPSAGLTIDRGARPSVPAAVEVMA